MLATQLVLDEWPAILATHQYTIITPPVQPKHLLSVDTRKAMPLLCLSQDDAITRENRMVRLLRAWLLRTRQMATGGAIGDVAEAFFVPAGIETLTIELPEGRYRVCLQESGYVFTRNAFHLDIDYLDEEMPCVLETLRIAVPASGYTPPTSTVTMTVSLIDAHGNPMWFREIDVTLRTPTRYESGTQFIVAKNRSTSMTDSSGHATITLIPGTQIEVSVANTGIVRRFTVPTEDFNLFDFLESGDLFDVQNQNYSPARKVS